MSYYNNKAEKPSQQRLKTYLERRHQSSEPPPSPEQIRRELGWGMIHLDKNKTR